MSSYFYSNLFSREKKICYIRADIDFIKMKISNKISAIILSVVASLATLSCNKVESSVKPEEILGSFIYNGNTYNIRSVVVYELDNGQTEIWLSETAGYTTVDQIEASVGELVITMQTSKIGDGKQTFEQDGKFIKYDSKVNSGWCTITCALDKTNKVMSLEFSSQKLKAVKNEIEGSYNGPYSEYTISKLENQWAYNRRASSITAVDYFEMEDGQPSKVVIYDEDTRAIEMYMEQSSIGLPITIGESASKGIVVLYDDGEEFKITNSEGKTTANGKVTIKPLKDQIEISIKLTNEGGKTLAAEYVGAYRYRYGNKTNRCIFDSGSEGYGYNGKFTVNEMRVSETSSDIIFTFTPGEHLGNGLVDQALVPTLKVSKSLVNAGEVDIKNTAYPWQFYYHNFQVYSYDANATDKTTAHEGSVMSIERDNNDNYTVNLEVSYMLKKIVTQDKVDENGDIVYEWVAKKDENGTPLLDENDDPIMEQVPVKEQVTIDVPASVDLFFNSSAN